MKNLIAIAAVSVMLSASAAFAACPCDTRAYFPGESAAPRISIVQPVVTPCCPVVQDPCCCNKTENKGFFSGITNFGKGLYDNTFGRVGSFFSPYFGY